VKVEEAVEEERAEGGRKSKTMLIFFLKNVVTF
jgi:hypothetical protein